MVGIAGGFPPVIGDDPYSEYPEGGPGDYPEMDSDPMYDPQNIGADPTMQPGAPPQQKKPGLMRRMMPAIGDMIRGGIDAVATPNVAGGATDMARAMQAAQIGKRQRDMASMQLAYQQQQQQEMMDYRRAQAEAARARAAATARGPAGPRPATSAHVVQDSKTGDWIDPTTAQIVRKADPKPAGTQLNVNVDRDGNLTDYAPGFEMGGVQYPGWSSPAKMTPEQLASMRNSQTGQANANRSRVEVDRGYDANGNRIITPIVKGADGSVTLGDTQKTGGQRPAPRTADPGRTTTRATPTLAIKNLAKQLVSEVNAPNATFEQKRDRAKQMLIQGVWGEHPAVANNKDALVAQIAALTEREFTGATGKDSGMPWKPKGATSTGAGGTAPKKTFPRAHLAGYAKRNGISEQSAEGSLNRQGYIVQ